MPFEPTLAPASEMCEFAVETSPSGMVMVDGAGEMVVVNPEIERLFGDRREELLGQSIDIRVPDRLRAQHVQRRREFKLRPEPRRMGAGRDLVDLRKDIAPVEGVSGLRPP